MVVLFDLDGTLTDPQVGIVRSIQYALRELGAPVPEHEALLQYIGPPLLPTFATLLGTDDPALTAAALEKYREHFRPTGMFENLVYPAIPAALAALRARNIPLFVATSKPAVFATEILQHFGLAQFFAGVYGSELDGTRANKAELIAYLLERERLDPRAAWMVGDREHDIIGARRNGVRAIGVLWGYGSRAELEAAGADLVIETPEELPGMLTI